MRIRLVLLALTTIALALVALPHRGVAAASMNTVHVVGKATGFLPAPCNCIAGIVIAIDARGSDDSFEGSGTTHATTGATNLFDVTGSVTGSTVILSGTVFQSTIPPVEGSPVQIEADSTTGALRFTLGPIAGGVFAGQTLVFDGAGNVIVTGK